jgi:hypothetical protein
LTARGITYWRKHRYHKCYKCHKYGHIAHDCENICLACGNLHNGSICVYSVEKLFKKINNKLEKCLIKDPEEIDRAIENFKNELQIENLKEVQYLPEKLTITSSSISFENNKQEPEEDEIIENDEEITDLSMLGIPGSNVSDNFLKKMSKRNRVHRENDGEKLKAKAENGGTTIQDNKAIKQLTEKIISFKKLGLNTEILEALRNQLEGKLPQVQISFNEYKCDIKEKLPSLRKLQLEKALTRYKTIQRKNRQWITDYEYFHEQNRDFKKLQDKNDELLGEIKAQEIELNNIKSNKKRIINETVEKAHEKAKQNYKKFFNQKVKDFNKKKNQFYDFKQQWENEMDEQTKESIWRKRQWKRRFQGDCKAESTYTNWCPHHDFEYPDSSVYHNSNFMESHGYHQPGDKDYKVEGNS